MARIKDRRATLDREHAPRFSAFEAMLPSETGLSRVLKFLLDAEAAHGQGPTFLYQFLDLIGFPKCESHSFHAATEYPTRDGRRIDILLRSRDYIIGIENKPWASEQDKQCQDYAEDLEWQMRGQWTLVFLTADGRTPETGGEFTSRIKPLKYQVLANEFNTKCTRVQQFLDDFRRDVRERICREASEPDMTEEIDEFLRPEHLDVTLEIVDHGSAIRRKLIEGLRKSLLIRIREDFGGDWFATERINFEEKNSGGLFFFKARWQGLYGIGFQNSSAAARDVWFGICYISERKSKTLVASGELKLALDKAFGIVGRTYPNWWDWYRPLRDLGKPEYQNWYKVGILKRMDTHGEQQMVEDLYPLVRTAILSGEAYIDREVEQT